MYTGQNELAVLRAQRIQAVSDCKFQEARELDGQLEHIKKEIEILKKMDTQRNAQMTYDAERDIILAKAEKTHSLSTEALYHCRIAYQKKLVSLQQSHANELQQLAEKYAKDLELAATRQVPESNVLRQEAKTNGLIRNYDGAEYLLEQSKQVYYQTIEQRQNDVHEHYARLKHAMITRHAVEDETCKEMYLKSVLNVERKHQKQSAVLEKRLDFRAYSLRAQVEPSPFVTSRLEFQDDEVLVVAPQKAKSAPVSALDHRMTSNRRPLTPTLGQAIKKNVNKK